MKKKVVIAIVFTLVFSLCLSINAFASVQSVDGSPISITKGMYSVTSYNTITIDSSHGAKATNTITSSPGASSTHLGVLARLQNSNFLIVKSTSLVHNSSNGIQSLSLATGYYNATSGTYYSGGRSEVWDTNENHYVSVQTPFSPGLTIGGSKSEGSNSYEVNKNGQTYGVVINAFSEKDYPDLVGAVGLDGTEGYIYSKELINYSTPASPEEAAALMTDKNYIQGRIINLYDSDGTTVVGSFLAGGLIGVTIQEDDITTVYNEDGTIVTTYPDGTETIACWR